MSANYYVDVTGTIDIKVRALQCHRSQVGDRPDFEDMVKNMARTNAADLDFEYAEGFHREIIDWGPFAYT